MTPRDTIVATATPQGRGGIAVLRISGHEVPRIAQAMLGGVPEPRYATFVKFLDAAGEAIDVGIALYFPAPGSFTGEPVLELHGHGSPVLQELLIERALQLGARRARPGEFSERAFLEDKLDLAQAEAVADVIAAGSRTAAQAAMRSLRGEFSARVDAAEEALIELRVYVEAAIDFPEEEIDFLASAEVAQRLAHVNQTLDAVTAGGTAGQSPHRRDDGRDRGATQCGQVHADEPSRRLRSRDRHRAARHHARRAARAARRGRSARHADRYRGPARAARTIRWSAKACVARARRCGARIACCSSSMPVADARADSFAQEKGALPHGRAGDAALQQERRARQRAADAAPALPHLYVSAATGAGLDALRQHLKDSAGYTDDGAGAVSAARATWMRSPAPAHSPNALARSSRAVMESSRPRSCARRSRRSARSPASSPATTCSARSSAVSASGSSRGVASIASGCITIWEGGGLWAFHVPASGEKTPRTDRHALTRCRSRSRSTARSRSTWRRAPLAGPAALVAADAEHAFEASGDGRSCSWNPRVAPAVG